MAHSRAVGVGLRGWELFLGEASLDVCWEARHLWGEDVRESGNRQTPVCCGLHVCSLVVHEQGGRRGCALSSQNHRQLLGNHIASRGPRCLSGKALMTLQQGELTELPSLCAHLGQSASPPLACLPGLQPPSPDCRLPVGRA